MFENVSITLEEFFANFYLSMLFNVILTVVVAVLVNRVVTKVVSTTAEKIDVEQEKVNVINNFFKILIGGLTFISILGSLHLDVTGLLAGVGIGALAVGFAAQTIISNLISGLFLIFEGVFTLGDYIQVGEVMGKVVSTNFRTTQIQTVDGNIVTIPNSNLASSQIINLTSGTDEMLLKIEEAVDIYADSKTAKKLMIEAAEATAGVIIDKAHTPLIIVDRDAGQWRMILKLYITVEASNWYRIQSNIEERIKQNFDSHGVFPPVTPIARSRLKDIRKELGI